MVGEVPHSDLLVVVCSTWPPVPRLAASSDDSKKCSTIPPLIVDGWRGGVFDTVKFVGEKREKSRDSSCLALPACGKVVWSTPLPLIRLLLLIGVW